MRNGGDERKYCSSKENPRGTRSIAKQAQIKIKMDTEVSEKMLAAQCGGEHAPEDALNSP